MRKLGLSAIRSKRNTSKPHPEHEIYLYLLRDRTIDQPNQVWSADITYIPMRRGFLYLVAIIDWASRRVLSWRLSNTLTASVKPSPSSADLTFSMPIRAHNSPARCSPGAAGSSDRDQHGSTRSLSRQHLR
jgi:hypothetical protein